MIGASSAVFFITFPASMKRHVLLPLLFIVSLVSALAGPLPRVEVAPGGHYLRTADGRPFFWLGDTAWRLIHYALPDECTYYLNTRAAQGFNVIQTVILSGDARKPNALGEVAFAEADSTRPNLKFFEHAVRVVDEAAALGLYVALIPTWGDKLTAPWGDGPRIFRTDNLDVARGYGRFIGTLFKDRTNIIWMIGGDRPARMAGVKSTFLRKLAQEAGFPPDQDWSPIWAAMSAGLADGLGRDPLCIYHPQGGEYSSSQQLPDVPWIDIHGMQSGHGGGHDLPVWEWIARDYALTPAKPTIDIEPNYEDHPYNRWPEWDPATVHFNAHDVRKQCYRSVFAGGAGVTYGHHSVWQHASHRTGVIDFPLFDWVNGLHRPAGQQMKFLRTLIESRPFFSRIPDQALVKAQPAEMRATHVVACRDREGTYALVYFPTMNLSVEIELGKLRSREVEAWWYDPRTGYSRPLGKFPAKPRTFKSPPYGPDWVLLLEDPAAHYPRPGIAP